MHIGFIGLGLMGRPLALHLAQAGHTLHLWARRPDSLDPFKAFDARVHASPAEVAKHAEIVFTMVADAPDVHAVILGDNGIAAGGRQGLIVVDMSTINPNAASAANWRRGASSSSTPRSPAEKWARSTPA
jgi:3-hydroxyisobutyrate dehydrogenase-like beta-hydroxyacid dehydrogenase